MSKDVKRDKNGRFVKKARKPIDVTIEVEKDKNCSGELTCMAKEEWEQMKLERDAFKELAEGMSSKYLNTRREMKDLERELDSYKRAYHKTKGIAEAWKGVAMKEQDKHLYAMDAVRMASMHIWWLRKHLSWLSQRVYRDKLQEMDIEMDRMVAKLEGLDKE